MTTPLAMPARRTTGAIASTRYSKHARNRMTEFGLTHEDIEWIVGNHDLAYPSEGDQVYTLGEWAVVESGTTGRVVTVLRRTMEQWEHDLTPAA